MAGIGNIEADVYGGIAGYYGYVGYNLDNGFSLGVGKTASAGPAGYTQIGVTLDFHFPPSLAEFYDVVDVTKTRTTGFGIATIPEMVPSITGGVFANIDGTYTGVLGRGVKNIGELGISITIAVDPRETFYPTHPWSYNPQGLYDPNPYTHPDPETGLYTTSGYTGINTGSLTTPRESVRSENWVSDPPTSGPGTSSSPETDGPGSGAPESHDPADPGPEPQPAPNPDGITTPVVIDLSLSDDADDQSSDGLTFFDLYNSPVFYNSDSDGFKERTAWVGPNEGIVVHSLTAEGKTVNEIALTKVYNNPSVPDADRATTDMEALWKMEAAYDGSDDGQHILTKDEATALNLKIWQDADMDGIVDAGEMKTFEEAGIEEIDMTESNLAQLEDEGDGANANQIVETRFSDGSVIFGTADVKLTNGKETTAYDMGFAHESAGIKEVLVNDYTSEIKLEKQSGGGNWEYLTATGTTAVDWDFDTAGKANYYGGTGTTGNDRMVYSGPLSRSFSGGLGADTLTGGQGDDFLIGGGGADRLSGRGGDDILYVDAQDVNGGLVDGGEGFDVVKVNSAAGVTLNMTQTNVEAFFGSAGSDVVNAGTRMIGVLLSGEGGNDTLTGGADSDILVGGDGNDILTGGDKHDQLIGGKGVDALDGGDGEDYIVADEHDNFAQVKGGLGFDVLVIDDSVDDTVAFAQQLNLTSMGFEAAVGGEGNDNFNVGSIERDTFLVGRGGNDTLKSGIGDDLLAGGKGNDLLDGGNGSDSYVFSREDGQDTIQETVGTSSAGGLDGIAFGPNIRVDDLQFSLVNNSDLLISVRVADGTALTGDTVQVKSWSTSNSQVEILAFGDGTLLDIGGAKFTTGTASAGLDVIDGGIGNNTIDALDGNDIVLGRAGNDTISGSRGHDYIDGGLGDDVLYGNEDDDSLMGGQGGGHDVLDGGVGDDFLDGEDGADTLYGGNGMDELWGGKGTDTISGQNGDDIIAGGRHDDILDGGLGDDVYFFERRDGRDTIYDAGSDDDHDLETIGSDPETGAPITEKVYHDQFAATRLGDRIAFGFDIRMTDLAFNLDSAGDLKIGVSRAGLIPDNLSSLADVVTVKNWSNDDKRIERINFYDGAVLYVEGIDGASTGSNASNVLDGGDNDNLLTGGGHADMIRGHNGNDILVGGAGDDDLRGQNGNDVVFGGSGNDIILGGDGNDRLFGGEGNDDISGNGEGVDGSAATADYIVGGAGDDTLRGNSGNDTYFFSFGDGNDKITEGSQDWQQGQPDNRENTIAFGSGIWFSDLKVTAANEQLTMEIVPLNRPTEEVTSITMEKHAVRQLEFANGYFAHFGDISNGSWGTEASETFDYSTYTKNGVWLSGNGGNDTLKGGDGRDILVGGEQNDTLIGKGGSDYYVFNAHDGRDTIFDGSGDSDSLAFGPGITFFDISLKSVDGDLVVSIRDDDRQDFSPVNAENSVTIKNWSTASAADAHIEWFDFTIGNSLEIGKISRALFKGSSQDNIDGNDNNEWIEGGTGGDTVHAGNGDDIVFGRDGYDTIVGGNGDDQVYGEGGNDNLSGNEGHDQIFGGNGDDILTDNVGSDYLYGGDGADTLRGGRGSNLLNGGEGDDTIYRGGYLEVTYTTSPSQGQVPSFDMVSEEPVRQISADEAVTVIEFAKGDGLDRLYVDNPADAALNGVHDQIDLIGISVEEVWFQKSSDNLILKILGTQDQMVFVDYHKGANYKFDRINADGQSLESGEIDALLAEMDKYTPNEGTSNVGLTSSELPDDLLALIHDKWDKVEIYVPSEETLA